MREGMLHAEVEKMKVQISKGLTFDAIAASLDPDTSRRHAFENFYKPLKAEFDKKPKPLPPPPTTQDCIACGKTHSLEARFCSACGAPFKDGKVAPVKPADDGLGLGLGTGAADGGKKGATGKL